VIHISLRKSKPRNMCIAEPHRTRGEGHKMSGMGGRKKNGENCLTGEDRFQNWPLIGG